jgi:hypothetical protein
MAAFLVNANPGAQAQSLDLAVSGYGLSIGNSTRFTGIRINAVDRQVEEINGLNLTLWNPRENPDAVYNGITLGVIGTKARRIHGIALSGIGVNAREHLMGIGAGTLGVGAGSLTGVAAGLVTVDIKARTRGIAIAGIWTGDCQQLDGMAISVGAAKAKNVRGVAIGLFAGGEQSLMGLSLGLAGFFSSRFRGVGIGGLGGGGEELQGVFAAGLGVGARSLDGIALTSGGIGGETLDGIMVAGLGLGATGHARGVAIGGLLVFAPEVTGLMAGAINGLYIDRIDLEDFLHFKMVNERFTGLSIGLVNYTAQLKGVQLGLFNYAGNNPRWLRLLPLVNVHL